MDSFAFHLNRFLWFTFVIVGIQIFGGRKAWLPTTAIPLAALLLRAISSESASGTSMPVQFFLDIAWFGLGGYLAVIIYERPTKKEEKPNAIQSNTQAPYHWEYQGNPLPPKRTVEIKDSTEEILESAEALSNKLTQSVASIAADLLKLESSSEISQQENFSRVHETLREIQDTLESFKDYAQPVKVTRKEMDLNLAILKIAGPILDKLPGLNVDFQLSQQPLSAAVHPESFERMFFPLLENAITAAGPEGKITVASYDTQSKICIEVMDNGPGISEAELDRIFQPFHTNKESSQGMGLAVVRRTIHAVAANLSVRNHPEGGCRFKLIFNRNHHEDAPATTDITSKTGVSWHA